MGSPGGVVCQQELDQCDDVGRFFFDWFASAAGTARAAGRYILIEQLLASASDGVRVQAKEFGQNAIASMAQLDGFQSCEQTTLLLVEQAVE